jgi:hypothetical protein
MPFVPVGQTSLLRSTYALPDNDLWEAIATLGEYVEVAVGIMEVSEG